MEIASIDQLDFDIRSLQGSYASHASEATSDHNDLGFGRMLHNKNSRTEKTHYSTKVYALIVEDFPATQSSLLNLSRSRLYLLNIFPGKNEKNDRFERS